VQERDLGRGSDAGDRAERDRADVCLVDPELRWVVRPSGRTVLEETATKPLSRPKKSAPSQEWNALCETFLMLARSHAVECQTLRERVEKLGDQLTETEEERGTPPIA